MLLSLGQPYDTCHTLHGALNFNLLYRLAQHTRLLQLHQTNTTRRQQSHHCHGHQSGCSLYLPVIYHRAQQHVQSLADHKRQQELMKAAKLRRERKLFSCLFFHRCLRREWERLIASRLDCLVVHQLTKEHSNQAGHGPFDICLSNSLQALRIRERHFPTSREYVQSLVTVGKLLMDCPRNNVHHHCEGSGPSAVVLQARSVLERALCLLIEQRFDDRDAGVLFLMAHTHSELGRVYYLTEQYKNAQEQCQNALRILNQQAKTARRTRDSSFATITDAHEILAQCYRTMGWCHYFQAMDAALALRNFHSELDVRLAAHNNSKGNASMTREKLAACRVELACFLFEINDDAVAALDENRKALLLQPSKSRQIDIYNNIAVVLATMGWLDAASDCLHHAMHLMEYNQNRIVDQELFYTVAGNLGRLFDSEFYEQKKSVSECCQQKSTSVRKSYTSSCIPSQDGVDRLCSICSDLFFLSSRFYLGSKEAEPGPSAQADEKESTERVGPFMFSLLLRHPQAANQRDPVSGRLPMHLALVGGMTWNDSNNNLQQLLEHTDQWEIQTDPVTGLPPFALADDVETALQLLRRAPVI